MDSLRGANLFVILGLLVMALAVVFVFLGQGSQMADDWQTRLDDSQQPLRRPAVVRQSRAGNRRADRLGSAAAGDAGRVAQLQAILRKRSAEYEALKKEFEQLIDQVTNELGIEPATKSGSSKTKAKSSADARIAELTAESEERVAELEKKANEEMEKLSRKAGEQLATLQEEGQQLIEMLEQERSVNTAATRILVDLGAAAVPALTNSLMAQDAETRQWAAEVLSDIGPDAGGAASALANALNDSDEGVRRAARDALESINQNN